MSTIVVGVSRSSGSPGALLFASQEAERRGAELVAVQAWRPPRPPAAPGGRPPEVSIDTELERRRAERELQSRVESVLGPTTGLSCRVVRGTADRVLARASADADLLVIDSPRTLVSRSSVLANRLLYTVRCPLVVLPPHAGSTTTRRGEAL